MNTKTRDNMEVLGKSFYVVRTQAGFRKALKHFRGDDLASESELRGYPTVYPSVVAFAYQYTGNIYVQARCLPLETFQKLRP
jgi:hypothetical protein